MLPDTEHLLNQQNLMDVHQMKMMKYLVQLDDECFFYHENKVEGVKGRLFDRDFCFGMGKCRNKFKDKLTHIIKINVIVWHF